jgi:type II secretory pathway pseudopilin PulG
VLAIIAIVGVVMAPRWFGGSSDPGCQAYTGTALPDYNKAIGDLNGHAAQSTLSAEINQAVSSLQAAANKAHSTSAKSALRGLLTELKTVQADVGRGSVPTSTVDALNNASTAADHACS